VYAMHLVKTLKDPKLNVLACGYADLFSIHNHWNFEHVSVPYWRLYWNKKPGAFLVHGRRRVKLAPSEMLLIAPHTIYSTRNHGHINQFFLHFQIILPQSNLKPQIVAIPAAAQLRNLANSIIAMLGRKKISLWQLSLYTRAFAELTLAGVTNDLFSGPFFDGRIQTAISYLENRLGESISNAILAAQAGMSVSAFVHLFKQQTRHSPCNFLMHKRIEKACLLLHFTDVSIKKIAEETGFCDRYHFSRVFKRWQGMGPAEFRSKNYTPFKEDTGNITTRQR